MIKPGHLTSLNDFIKQRIAIGFNEIVPLSSNTVIEETVDEIFSSDPVTNDLSTEEKIILFIRIGTSFLS
jgi:hypothetical protein